MARDDAGFYDDLDGSLAEAWARLARATADRRSALHTVQLASVGADGGPRVRTLVLRGVEPGARLLRLHTDRRSPKAAEFAADPRAELCAYDPKAKIQIRARGRVAVHLDDAVGRAAWDASQPGARVCYRAPAGPGTPLAEPALGDPTAAARAPAHPDDGREHFSALSLTVERLEWLYLAARGHRRAAFDWSGGAWTGRWLAP
jgi:pyridoxine/pyridoxamine 5'-phosphate oxidase